MYFACVDFWNLIMYYYYIFIYIIVLLEKAIMEKVKSFWHFSFLCLFHLSQNTCRLPYYP